MQEVIKNVIIALRVMLDQTKELIIKVATLKEKQIKRWTIKVHFYLSSISLLQVSSSLTPPEV